MALSRAGHINDNDNKDTADVRIDPDGRPWCVMVFNGWCSQSTLTPSSTFKLLALTLICALPMAGNPNSHACGQDVRGLINIDYCITYDQG